MQAWTVDLAEVVRRRRMVRAFDGRPVAPEALARVLDICRRGPSAGFSQGLDLLVLEGPEQTGRYWEHSFPDPADRARFRWQGLFAAPVLVVPVVAPGAYAGRYAEPDKAGSGVADPAAWTVPYWWVDGGMAVMLLLLAAEDEGLGALFFTLERPDTVLNALGVPDDRLALGTIALGHPVADEPGRSSKRPRRPLTDVVHRGRWSSAWAGPGQAGPSRARRASTDVAGSRQE
jgi:nitroreductase